MQAIYFSSGKEGVLKRAYIACSLKLQKSSYEYTNCGY